MFKLTKSEWVVIVLSIFMIVVFATAAVRQEDSYSTMYNGQSGAINVGSGDTPPR